MTNKELVASLYSSLMAEGDADTAFKILDENYRDHDIPGFPNGGGREELSMAVMAVRRAFPDIKPELYEMVEENNLVAVRVEALGHHTGENFMGIAPTGKKIRWKEIHLFKCAKGKIIEHRGVFDLMAIMQQLQAN
jgi:predicted SnoaL-like aldol condensation-catalyzing enzyme